MTEIPAEAQSDPMVLDRRSALGLSAAAATILWAGGPFETAVAATMPARQDGDTLHPLTALATPEQRLIEGRALDIFSTPRIVAAIAQIRDEFRADKNARLPDQGALIEQSAREHFFHAALMAASETPASPRFIWTLALPHRWMGLDVPGSRWGHDNTDNAYRGATIDPAMEYRITGRFVEKAPSDFSITALPAQVGEGIAADVVGIVTPDMIDIDPDGRFVIAVDATPTNGRRNHLTIAGAKFLFVRDSMGDWATERPSQLHIERIDGPKLDDYSMDKATVRAAELGTSIARFFLKAIQHGMFEKLAANSIVAPVPSGSRGGLVTQWGAVGHFALEEDEALIITVDRGGARYLGIQLVDLWMLSYEYAHHTSSLNHAQAIADADGKYRWVISPRDPGVHNWLDASGGRFGDVTIRWQQMPDKGKILASATGEKVRLADLRSHLPPGTAYLNAQQRSQQRAKRFSDYNGRLR